MASSCSQEILAYFMVCPIETKILPFNIANKSITVRSHKVTGMFIKLAPNLMLRFCFGSPISDPNFSWIRVHVASIFVKCAKRKTKRIAT